MHARIRHLFVFSVALSFLIPAFSSEVKKSNRLVHEKSPYLLQHAYNPVDWYPWGKEAFDAATKRNVPIFLSIGYSTCHWCHVMERESFEDPGVAKLLNANYVSIKVDREERPDIDNAYMAIAQMMTGGGGWPLTILMTPDKKPFHAATYIPKDGRFGSSGLMELLPRVSDTWKKDRQKVVNSATKITQTFTGQNLNATAGGDLGIRELKLAYEQLRQSFDSTHGGFGFAPKFPTPHKLLFLLRYWKRSGDATALQMVEKTLKVMRARGIYDHVGFGFHRYSTDIRWFAPHFEKMLYDQALLTMVYTEAFQATGNKFYAQTAKEIIAYVLGDLTHAQGGFLSAEDADTEGEEGLYYLWSMDEIKASLPPVESEWMIKTFKLKSQGNFSAEQGKAKGRNILSLEKPFELATDIARFEKDRLILNAIRKKRAHPQKDDKILTDWNGLMIAALAKAGAALGRPEYILAAEKAADFVLATLRNSDGTLIHRYRQGNAALPAHVDDYAFMAWGLIELYEANFNIKYLEAALGLNKIQIQDFWDDGVGGFYFTSKKGEKILSRQKEIYDGYIPAGNSVSMFNLLRLGRMTGATELEQKASQLTKAFSGQVGKDPSSYTLMMSALDFAVGPSFEIVIAGDIKGQDTQRMLATLRKHYQPRKVVVFRPMTEAEPPIVKLAKYTRLQTALNGKATAYVCKNFVCDFPTQDPNKMLIALKKTVSDPRAGPIHK